MTYAAPAEVVRERVPRDFGPVEPRGADACTVRLGDDDLDWLALRIAIAGVPFTVQGPPELRDRLETFAARFAAAAG